MVRTLELFGKVNFRKMAKYDSLRKQARNRLLVGFAEANPDLSHREIGDIFGLTKQRVGYILRRERLKGDNLTPASLERRNNVNNETG